MREESVMKMHPKLDKGKQNNIVLPCFRNVCHFRGQSCVYLEGETVDADAIQLLDQISNLMGKSRIFFVLLPTSMFIYKYVCICTVRLLIAVYYVLFKLCNYPELVRPYKDKASLTV